MPAVQLIERAVEFVNRRAAIGAERHAMIVSPDVIGSYIRARAARPRWAGVPADHRPESMERGYELQKAVYDRLAALGVRRVGYKVGSTSAAGQKTFGLSEPVYAGIFEETRKSFLDDALSADLIEPLVECEIALCLRHDLDPAKSAITVSDIADAVETCHLACEIVDNRYGDPLALGLPTILADDCFHASFVLGPPNTKWPNLDFANLNAAIEVDGTIVQGNSNDVLSPFKSVQWLARKLALFGTCLRAGEIILTGSIVVPTKVRPPLTSLSISIEGFEPLRLGHNS